MNETTCSPVETSSRASFPYVAAGLLAVLGWVVAWYFDTAVEIAGIWWRSDTFAHGLIVLPLFAWLVWRARDRIEGLLPRPVPLMIVPAALAGFGWLLGDMVSVAAVTHVGLAGVLLSAFVGFLGWRLARALAFPLLFLLFGVPVGEFLLPVLMRYTAEFTVLALRASGVPVYQEGLHFIVPNGRWSVVEACSGIRYLIASLMVGSLYAYLSYTSWRRRAAFMLVALLVPIVANWVRAYLIVMLGYLTDNELAAGVDHLIYGWVFFGVVIMTMFWIGRRWQEPPAVRRPAAIPGGAAATRAWPLVALLAVVAFFPLLRHWQKQPVADFPVAIEAPSPASGWQRMDGASFPLRPHFLGHRGEQLAVYRSPEGRDVALYIAYYADQRPEREMIAWGNRIVGPNDEDWRSLESARDSLGTLATVRTLAVASSIRVDSWHWYWTERRAFTSDYLGKALLALDMLSGQADDSAVIAVMVRQENDDPAASRRLAESFIAGHRPAIDALLQRAQATVRAARP